MHGCRNRFLRVQENIMSEWLFWNICSWFFLNFRLWPDNYHTFDKNWITHNFLHFFENSSVKFTEICENFQYGCKNCILHVRRNNSREIWCWGQKFTVFITFDFKSKYVRSFCGKISARWSKLHFASRDDHSNKEKISRIKQNFWFFLGIRASNLRSLVGQLHARLSKLHSTCRKEQFEKKLVMGKTFTVFITLEIYSKYVRSSCGEVSAWCS